MMWVERGGKGILWLWLPTDEKTKILFLDFGALLVLCSEIMENESFTCHFPWE